MLAQTAVLLTLAASALANPFLTSPVASTTCSGGKTCKVIWQDDGEAPDLKTFGLSTVGVYVGSKTVQTQLQAISGNVSVDTTSEIDFTVDPTIGPNGDFYFIRIQSATARNGNDPAQAFSARFTLDSMTGTLTPEVSAQIAGATASGASSTGSSSGSSTASATVTTSRVSSGTASATTSKASTTQSASAANRNGVAAGAAGFAGILAALIAL